MLFLSLFSTHSSAEDLIRPGYAEYKMIDSQSTFSGNIVIEGLANPAKYMNKKFKVYFIKPEKKEIIPKTYMSRKFIKPKGDEIYYEIDTPDLLLSPYPHKDKEIKGDYFNFLVTNEDFFVRQITIFDHATVQKEEIEKIEKFFSAKFMKNFPDYVYEGNLKYDVPFISVRFSSPNWLLVDSYLLREGVDYGYGYYVPSFNVENQENKKLGQYLYNRKTGDVILLKKAHLIDDTQPILIEGKNATYLSCYISIGKSYGHDEIFEIKNKKVETVFIGSDTGS